MNSDVIVPDFLVFHEAAWCCLALGLREDAFSLPP